MVRWSKSERKGPFGFESEMIKMVRMKGTTNDLPQMGNRMSKKAALCLKKATKENRKMDKRTKKTIGAVGMATTYVHT